MTGPARAVLLVAHVRREPACLAARLAAERLLTAGLEVRVLAPEAAQIGATGVTVVPADGHAADGCELVVVLGGDGTLLRGAELTRGAEAALLGVNLGHVGFLAEAEEDDLTAVVERVVVRDYVVEERLTLDVVVLRDRTGAATEVRTWAVNEASVEKGAREKMIDVIVEVDGRPLSRWGTDGVVCATPTGSTAYAFSAGGPVVWPEVEALLLVPISAHALFARPLVVAPTSVLAVELGATSSGVLWCDGRRLVELEPEDRVEVRRSTVPLRLARLHPLPFTDRLVRKFDLPVQGWRGRRGQR
ncbi:MAG: NAD kinase [Actinomycetia bacterium]|jgi:NAD+ kinase|nr:NAD kinase [Actinomycetes bacterium]